MSGDFQLESSDLYTRRITGKSIHGKSGISSKNDTEVYFTKPSIPDYEEISFELPKNRQQPQPSTVPTTEQQR